MLLILSCMLLLLFGVVLYRKDLQIQMKWFMNWICGPPKTLDLNELPPVTQLSSNCIRVLGLNPGAMTLHGTNTYIIGTGGSRILIDTGQGMTKYMNLLQQVLKTHEIAEISDVLITHQHGDHIGGVKQIKQLFPNVRVWKHMSEDMSGYREMVEGDTFRTQGATLRVVATPGHTDDHVCFYMSQGHESVLFSGDCVLGSNSSTVFTDLAAYLKSLKKLLALNQKFTIYPGHGQIVADGVSKIKDYIAHRKKREDAILRALDQVEWATIPELVELVYRNSIPFHLKYSARRSIASHISKLEQEKLVVVHRQKVTKYWGVIKAEQVLCSKNSQTRPCPSRSIGISSRYWCAAFGIFLYANTIWGEFCMDDTAAVVKNRDVRHFSWDIFRHDYWGTPIESVKSHKSYRPITVLTFCMDYFIYGLNPMGFHLTNVFLYGLCCHLAHRAAFRILRQPQLAFLAALIFTAHPIHTEAVANIVGRAEIISGIFYFAAILSKSTAGVFLFTFLAMLSKETGLMAIPVILVLENRIFKGYVEYLLILLALIFRKFITKTSFGPAFSFVDNYLFYAPTLTARVLSYGYLHVRYMWLLVFPLYLSCDYSYQAFPLVESLLDPRVAFIVLLYLVMLLIFWKGLEKPVVFHAFACLVISFIPSSNIFFPVATVIGERLLFLPSFGFALLIVQPLEKHLYRPKIRFALICLLVCYASRTIGRNLEWQTPLSLYKSATVTVPTSCKVHVSLAAAELEKNGPTKHVLASLHRSLEILPTYSGATFLLGNFYTQLNRTDDAIRAYEQTIELCRRDEFKPDLFVITLNNLATIYMSERQDWTRARHVLEEAVKMDSDRYSLHANIAQVYSKQKEWQRAIFHYKKALELSESADVYNNLAIAVYQLKGKASLNEIRLYYQRAVELDPQHAQALENLSKIGYIS